MAIEEGALLGVDELCAVTHWLNFRRRQGDRNPCLPLVQGIGINDATVLNDLLIAGVESKDRTA